MIAVDESAYARKFLKAVVDRTWPDGCQFKLITVIEPLELSNEKKHEEVLCEIRQKRMEAAQKFLAASRAELQNVSGANVHFEIREGHPLEQIIDSAVQWEPERLIVGAHGSGKSGIKKTVGNVSRSVALHSPCTVEIVRV